MKCFVKAWEKVDGFSHGVYSVIYDPKISELYYSVSFKLSVIIDCNIFPIFDRTLKNGNL